MGARERRDQVAQTVGPGLEAGRRKMLRQATPDAALVAGQPRNEHELAKTFTQIGDHAAPSPQGVQYGKDPSIHKYQCILLSIQH